MKILWFYKYFKKFNTDHWLHMDFARYINNIPGMELQAVQAYQLFIYA